MGILGILWLILKIILYILLGILILVLTIITLILFVPIRYHTYGHKYNDDIDINFRVSWLLRIFRAVGRFHNDLSYKVKILFFTVLKSNAENKEGGKDNTLKLDSDHTEDSEDNSEDADFDELIEMLQAEKDKAEGSGHQSETTSDFDEEESPSIKELLKTYGVDRTEAENVQRDVAETTIQEQSESTKPPNSIEHSIEEDTFSPVSKEEVIEDINNDFPQTTRFKKSRKVREQKRADKAIENEVKAKEKAEKKLEKEQAKNSKKEKKEQGKKFDFNKILDIIKNEDHHVAVKFTLRRIKKIILSILPKKFKTKATIGLDDPATTGYIAGFGSIIRPLTNNGIDIIPNFTEEELSGEFNIKGRIFICIIVYNGIRIILKKEVRKLIKQVRNLRR